MRIWFDDPAVFEETHFDEPLERVLTLVRPTRSGSVLSRSRADNYPFVDDGAIHPLHPGMVPGDIGRGPR